MGGLLEGGRDLKEGGRERSRELIRSSKGSTLVPLPSLFPPSPQIPPDSKITSISFSR